MMSLLTSLLMSAAVVVVSTAGVEPVPKMDPDRPPEELRGVPPEWLRNSWPSNLQEAQLVILAYDLDDEVLPAFWHLFYLRLVEEYQYQMAYYQNLNQDAPPEEAMEKLIAFAENMPTGPDKLCDMVESLLEQGDHSLQRVRFFELRDRRDGLIWLKEDGRLRTTSLRRRLKRHRLLRAGLTSGGKPIPTWAHARLQLEAARKLEQDQLAEDALTAAARRRASRDPIGSTRHRSAAAGSGRTLTPALSLEGRGSNGGSDGTSMDGETAEPLIAAHEDATYQSWRAALRSCLARPGLSDADRRSARKVFDQWWSTARAHRQLRKADYEQIASLTSRKTHQTRLLTLDKPLEGLFAEFRLRLAAIGPQPAAATGASQ